MTRPRRRSLGRWSVAVALSAGLNASLVSSLAQLDRPPEAADPHREHAVRPSVVPPPPPPRPEARAAGGAAASPSALPAPPPMPDLALPELARDGSAEGLGWSGEDGRGLGEFPRLSGDWDPTEGPDAAPRLAVPPELGRFYPAEARRRGLGGTTLLELEVDATGRVRDATVLRADPPGLFDAAALRAAPTLRFEPAQRGGRPVAGTARLELSWRARKGD